MQRRRLGAHGPEVPPIVLGGNVYGWTLDEAGAFRQLERALDAGLNFVDTADVYSRWVPGHVGGESETNPAELRRAPATAWIPRPRSYPAPASAAPPARAFRPGW
jgi:aryl-alcohol dehydrogenase-like predicted oxidoreductase